jgi:D-glycero-alpha-D-manno-heptose 1-phosphate guanylyltransferase
VVLSVGYLGDLIARHFGERFEGLVIDYCFEEQPLGTGGAICAAIAGTSASTVLVMNGDTFVEFDPARLVSLREKHHAHVAIGSVLVDDASRYGHIRIGANARVIAIDEKTHQGPGPINAGVYAVDPAWIRAAGSVLASPHSFEKGLLTDAIQAGKVVADTVSGRFIDIGIPEDFERAGKLLAQS